jgi:putative Mg2+ transporter-C (MgtC) family protein
LLASSVPSLHWSEALLRLALAAAMGAAIGIERERRGREAGLRTHLLVSLGSALFTIVSAYGFHSFLASGASVVRADPTRIAAQIVTGIGFLGAGAIIRQGLSVRGLTTAATLWVVAAIGLAAGAGYYSAAVVATVLVLVSLWPLRILAYRIFLRYRPDRRRLLVDLAPGRSAAPVLAAVEQIGGAVESLAVTGDEERRSLALEVDLTEEARREAMSMLGELEGVRGIRWGQ